MNHQDTYYKDYLALNKILNAQERENPEAHDEMLFIIIHQAYELWFKQIIFELDSVLEIFSQPQIADNSPDIYVANHRLARIVSILKVLVQQIDLMETMTSLDFLDFRDYLRPASGFQGTQFKLIEAKLGLEMPERHGKQYYTSQLRPEDKSKIESIEKETSLITLLNNWLERMPFFKRKKLWKEYQPLATPIKGLHPFWSDYLKIYSDSLLPPERSNIRMFKKIFIEETGEYSRKFSRLANRNALFIVLYRDFPLLQPAFRLLNILLEIDEQLSAWRFRHMFMVHRIIGTRVGTGGSTGKGYLKAAMDKHIIFKEVADLTTFLIARHNLPPLPHRLQKRLGFLDHKDLLHIP